MMIAKHFLLHAAFLVSFLAPVYVAQADTTVIVYTDEQIEELAARAAKLEYMTFGGRNMPREERQALGLEIPMTNLRSYIGVSDQVIEQNAEAGDYAAMWIMFQKKAAANDLDGAALIARDAIIIHEIPFLADLLAGYHMDMRSDPAEAIKWVTLAARFMPDYPMYYTNFLNFLGTRLSAGQVISAEQWADGEIKVLEAQRRRRFGSEFTRIRDRE